MPCSPGFESFPPFPWFGDNPRPLFALTQPSPLTVASPVGAGQSLTALVKSVHIDRLVAGVRNWVLGHVISICYDSSNTTSATLSPRFCFSGGEHNPGDDPRT